MTQMDGVKGYIFRSGSLPPKFSWKVRPLLELQVITKFIQE